MVNVFFFKVKIPFAEQFGASRGHRGVKHQTPPKPHNTNFSQGNLSIKKTVNLLNMVWNFYPRKPSFLNFWVDWPNQAALFIYH